MATTQYIGARYVPLFADPLDWDKTKEYEPLTIVYYQGNSYTSRQSVPTGIDITNERYWALTGNYNAQVETYRKEVTQVTGKADQAIEAATDAVNQVEAEVTRAEAAEKANAEAVKAEEVRAKAAESELEAKVEKAVQGMQLTAAFIEPEYLGRFAFAGGEYSAQGACVHNGTIVSAVSNNSLTTFYTNAIGADTVGTYSGKSGFMHAQSLTSDGSKLYCVPLYDGTTTGHTKNVLVVNPSTFAIEQTFALSFYPYNITYDKAQGKMYVMEDNNTRDIYELDLTSHATTKVMTPENASSYLVQDFCAHDGVFYVAFYTPSCIASYDIEGKVISITQLPSEIGFHDAQEIESVDYYDGNLYCTFNGYQSGADTSFNVVARVNVNKGNMYVTVDNPQAYAARIYNYATAADLNGSFYYDGSSSKPYPSIQEAVMACFYNGYSIGVYASGVFNENVQCNRDGKLVKIQSAGYSARATCHAIEVAGDIQVSNMIIDGSGEENAVHSHQGNIYVYNTQISNATNGIRSENGAYVRLVGASSISVTGSKVYMASAGILNVPSSFSAADVHWTQSGKILTAN